MFSLFGKKKEPLLDAEAERSIVACIKAAEARTSGEIRVFVEGRCKFVDPMDRAKEIFTSLGMEKTDERNATIIYVAMLDRQFALFGDTAIYEKAGGPPFWAAAAEHLVRHLQKNEVTEGLQHCINELGNALAANFPPNPHVNKNELPDEIVFGK
ncbi:MAG: TPM domain-containing protein [Bacteroidota bacterium]